MSEFHDVYPDYEGLAHHDETAGKKIRKKLWKVFWHDDMTENTHGASLFIRSSTADQYRRISQVIDRGRTLDTFVRPFRI